MTEKKDILQETVPAVIIPNGERLPAGSLDPPTTPTAAAGAEVSGLTESRQLAPLGDILELAPDAIISVNEGQTIVLFNESAARVFGYTPQEVLGQPLEMLLPKEVRQFHRGHVEFFGKGSVRMRTMRQRGQVSGVKKNGEQFPSRPPFPKAKSTVTSSSRSIYGNPRLRLFQRSGHPVRCTGWFSSFPPAPPSFIFHTKPLRPWFLFTLHRKQVIPTAVADRDFSYDFSWSGLNPRNPSKIGETRYFLKRFIKGTQDGSDQPYGCRGQAPGRQPLALGEKQPATLRNRFWPGIFSRPV